MGGCYHRGINWVDSVKWHFANTTESGIVILTAGAHVNNRSNFEIVVNYVIEGSKDIKQMYPNIQIVWKTQQPAGCTLKISHQKFLLAMITIIIYSMKGICMLCLCCHSMAYISLICLCYTIDLMLIDHLTNDYFHFCMPGPLDVIAPLFSWLLDRLAWMLPVASVEIGKWVMHYFDGIKQG